MRPETTRAARPNRGAALESPEPAHRITPHAPHRQRRPFPSPDFRSLLKAGALARFLGLVESREPA